MPASQRAERPTYLHQILAVDLGIEADAKRALAEAIRILAVGGKQDPLTGLSDTYESNDQVRWPAKPAESRRVQFTTAGLLENAVAAMTRLLDVKLTREAGNAEARADIIIDGEVLLADVPVGYLMFLENRISSLITMLIDHLPVRDPAQEWHGQETDPNLPRGVYATEPRVTPTTTKDKLVQTIAEPKVIEGHAFPGQYAPYDGDVTTGTKTAISYSGQLSVKDVQDLRERAVTMLIAVRYAREQANTLEVTNRKAGAVILGRIFGDLVPQQAQ
jgi:hypothetical protein